MKQDKTKYHSNLQNVNNTLQANIHYNKISQYEVEYYIKQIISFINNPL